MKVEVALGCLGCDCWSWVSRVRRAGGIES